MSAGIGCKKNHKLFFFMESIAASVLFDGSDLSRLSRCMCFCLEASFICPSGFAPAIAQRARAADRAKSRYLLKRLARLTGLWTRGDRCGDRDEVKRMYFTSTLVPKP